jgi:hypothetical protein
MDPRTVTRGGTTYRQSVAKIGRRKTVPAEEPAPTSATPPKLYAVLSHSLSEQLLAADGRR